MAQMILTIPGIEMTVTDVRKAENEIILEIAARVTNWWRLLYWYIREYYEIPWYMWPYVLMLVAMHGFKGELGLYDH
jgi:uncharacterized membrane protein